MGSKATKKIEGTVVKIEFASGETLEADVASLSDDLKLRALAHGVSQKLGDSYAGADASEAYGCAKKVWDELIAGNWNVRSEGGGGRTSIFIEALARVLKCSIEEAQEKFDSVDEDKQKAMKKHAQIKAASAQIKAERAAKELEKANAAAAEGGEAFSL